MSADTPSNEPILLRDDNDNGITTLTLNRPAKRNALSTELLGELQTALNAIADDKSVKVVILQGNGPAFCSGHDLKEMRADSSFDAIHGLFKQCSEVMLTMTRLPQPVIARVHGIATAAGCQLVATCDLAVASDDARFATPGVTNGLFCSTPAVAVSRSLSRKHTLELLLMGELIDAETAFRYGLVNKTVPADQLDAAVAEFAESIASRSTLTISFGKKAFYEQVELELEDAYAFASEAMAKNMMEPDAAEGIDAFLEKRAPAWQGR